MNRTSATAKDLRALVGHVLGHVPGAGTGAALAPSLAYLCATLCENGHAIDPSRASEVTFHEFVGALAQVRGASEVATWAACVRRLR
jgi:hypothetical protein